MVCELGSTFHDIAVLHRKILSRAGLLMSLIDLPIVSNFIIKLDEYMYPTDWRNTRRLVLTDFALPPTPTYNPKLKQKKTKSSSGHLLLHLWIIHYHTPFSIRVIQSSLGESVLWQAGKQEERKKASNRTGINSSSSLCFAIGVEKRLDNLQSICRASTIRLHLLTWREHHVSSTLSSVYYK